MSELLTSTPSTMFVYFGAFLIDGEIRKIPISTCDVTQMLIMTSEKWFKAFFIAWPGRFLFQCKQLKRLIETMQMR